jgi:hypothetical protein
MQETKSSSSNDIYDNLVALPQRFQNLLRIRRDEQGKIPKKRKPYKNSKKKTNPMFTMTLVRSHPSKSGEEGILPRGTLNRGRSWSEASSNDESGSLPNSPATSSMPMKNATTSVNNHLQTISAHNCIDQQQILIPLTSQNLALMQRPPSGSHSNLHQQHYSYHDPPSPLAPPGHSHHGTCPPPPPPHHHHHLSYSSPADTAEIESPRKISRSWSQSSVHSDDSSCSNSNYSGYSGYSGYSSSNHLERVSSHMMQSLRVSEPGTPSKSLLPPSSLLFSTAPTITTDIETKPQSAVFTSNVAGYSTPSYAGCAALSPLPSHATTHIAEEEREIGRLLSTLSPLIFLPHSPPTMTTQNHVSLSQSVCQNEQKDGIGQLHDLRIMENLISEVESISLSIFEDYDEQVDGIAAAENITENMQKKWKNEDNKEEEEEEEDNDEEIQRTIDLSKLGEMDQSTFSHLNFTPLSIVFGDEEDDIFEHLNS